MQREPLTEQAAGRESLANRAKMFERVKGTRAGARRMKEVGHDHIIPRAGCANETAGVGDEHFQCRLALRRKVVGSKLRHELDHFRYEFNAVALQAGMQ